MSAPESHPVAVIAASAVVDPTSSIGPFVVIESAARIGAGVTLGAHFFIGASCEIGEGGWLAPRVTLYHDVRIGKRVVIQSGAVLSGEGFGFAMEKGIWQESAQIGGVDRKNVVSGKSVSVRVDLGDRRLIKKQKTSRNNTECILIQQ